MRHFMKRVALLVALSIMTLTVGYAQGPSKAETQVKEIVERYDAVKGVESVTVAKGSGLEMFKMMFNKQFGKDFMKGVKSITIINYTDASEDVCQRLRNELDLFVSLLEEFNLNKDKSVDEHSYIRSFASTVKENTISDFVVAMENESMKMIMYMAGDIKVQ